MKKSRKKILKIIKEFDDMIKSLKLKGNPVILELGIDLVSKNRKKVKVI